MDLLAWLGLAGVPAVVALHLLRRRFPRRVVSALFLWDARVAASAAGPRRERLRREASFWLEVLAASALAAFLLPRGCDDPSGEHLVVVLDGSAALDAQFDGRTVADRVRRFLVEEAERGAWSAAVTVVESGAVPRLLVGPAGSAVELETVLASWQPMQIRHGLDAALDVARGFADGGRILLLTDRLPADDEARMPPDLEVRAFGRAVDNAGFVSATRRPADDDLHADEVRVVVEAFSSGPLERRVEVLASGTLLADRSIRVLPGQPHALSLRVPADVERVAVRMAADAFRLDDVCYLAQPLRRQLRLASLLDDTVELRLGLRSPRAGEADRWRSLSGDASLSEPEHAHLVIGGEGAEGGPEAWILHVVPEPSDSGPRRDLVGPFLVDRSEALCQGLVLEGVVWSVQAERALPGVPLISAGNLPLLSAVEDGARRDLWLNLDVTRSNLQFCPDWPILLANLAEERRRNLPGPSRTNPTLGETLTWAGGKSGRVSFSGPDGARREFPTLGILDVLAPAPPGFWTVSDPGGESALLGVTFLDAATSDLRGAGTGHRRATASAPRQSLHDPRLDVALLLALLVLVVLDWRVLRATTVAAEPRES